MNEKEKFVIKLYRQTTWKTVGIDELRAKNTSYRKIANSKDWGLQRFINRCNKKIKEKKRGDWWVCLTCWQVILDHN